MAVWTTPTPYATNGSVTSTQWNTWIRDNLMAISPVGIYCYMHASATRVENFINGCWLECNGVAVSRSVYSDLFSKIGTTYGAGNGATTFNLPDYAGRAPVGLARTGGHSDVTSLGANEGAALGVRRIKHRHSFSESTHNHSASTGTSFGPNSDDGHQHNSLIPNYINNATGLAPVSVPEFSSWTTHSTSTNGSHTHPVTAGTTGPSAEPTVDPGGSRPVDAPAYLVAGIWCIKAVI